MLLQSQQWSLWRCSLGNYIWNQLHQSINQSILFLIKRYIINALSAVQWNTHTLVWTHTYIYIYIYSEIQHTYKHSYKAAISAQVQCFYFIHTHFHTRGRCERPAPSLFLAIHLQSWRAHQARRPRCSSSLDSTTHDLHQLSRSRRRSLSPGRNEPRSSAWQASRPTTQPQPPA